MVRCRELKDGFSVWQKTQQTFLSNLIKFRLSTVPTVTKRQSQKTVAKSSVSSVTAENNQLSEKVSAAIRDNNTKHESTEECGK